MDEFLKASPFKPIATFYKGAIPKHETQPRPDTGFTLLVGQDDGPDLRSQVQAAIQFLARHEKELDRLREFGADTLLFDFGFTPPDRLQSSVHLPAELLLMMARFGMGVIFSVVQIPRG